MTQGIPHLQKHTRITFDASTKARTFKERGLSFEDVEEVLAGVVVHIPDDRRDYGEERIVTFGTLSGRIGGRGLDAAWRGLPRDQHEEGQ